MNLSRQLIAVVYGQSNLQHVIILYLYYCIIVLGRLLEHFLVPCCPVHLFYSCVLCAFYFLTNKMMMMMMMMNNQKYTKHTNHGRIARRDSGVLGRAIPTPST